MSDDNLPDSPGEVPEDAPKPTERGDIPGFSRAIEDNLYLTASAAEIEAAEAKEELVSPDDKDDEPEPEPYAGEYKPNPNVELPLPILEELSEETLQKFAKQGSVIISNMTGDEIKQISDTVSRQVGEKQPERRRLAEDGLAGKYRGIKMGNNQILFLTEGEATTLDLINTYTASLRVPYGKDLFDDADGGWTNKPAKGDHVVAIGRKRMDKAKNPIDRIYGKLNLNTRYSAPMWHSGMQIELEGAGVLDQLRLESQILSDKITQGRQSLGYVYSANAVYMNRPVCDFLLDHVRASTAGTTDKNELMKILLITDLEPLATAGAATIWPDGYLLERPCLTDRGGCGHVLSRKMNIGRMLVVRRKRITDAQMNVMIKSTSLVDSSIIRAYQEQMRPEVTRLIPIGDGTYLKMAVPTLEQYFRVAGAWMEGLESRSRDLAVSSATREQREQYLQRATGVALIMAYGHWIEAVVEEDPDDQAKMVTAFSRIVEDEDDMEAQYKADQDMDRFLERMSEDATRTNIIVEAIEKFIDAMTLATTVVPKAICPNCGKPVSGDETSNHPHLVPVNPIELFFTLLRLKVQQAGG